MEFLEQYYLWLKAIHIIALVSWMAMLFYLPRLFVYHAQNTHNKDFIAIVKLQEMRLYKYIGMPAFVLTFISGVALILRDFPAIFHSGGWFHAKLFVLVLLFVYHFLCGYFIKSLKNDTCKKSERFFRIYNEFPTLCLIAIVIFVIVKPF